MATLPDAQLAHFGFHVHDMDVMIEFYQRTLGMVVTDSGDYYMGGQIAFLSRNASEHHQLVLASGRNVDGTTKLINQISFKVGNLEDLQAYYNWLVPLNVADMNPRNHGNAWSIYFRDPEGNRIEIYTPTPWYVGQPFGLPLDLTEPVENIRATTEALVKDNPTLVSSDEWSKLLDRKIRGETAN